MPTDISTNFIAYLSAFFEPLPAYVSAHRCFNFSAYESADFFTLCAASISPHKPAFISTINGTVRTTYAAPFDVSFVPAFFVTHVSADDSADILFISSTF